MIVEFLLPELAVKLFPIFVSGRLFEIFHEPHQVARRLDAAERSVKMIGHHAIGVYRKPIGDGFLAKTLDQPNGISGARENRTPARAAHRHEIRGLSYVADRVQ